MNSIQRLQESLRNAYDGKNWYGPTLKDILNDVDAETAAKDPIAGYPSIWRIVHHITGWIREVQRGLSGESLVDPSEWDWKEVDDSSEAAWQQSLGDLDQAHQNLLAALDGFSEDRLDEPVMLGEDLPGGFTHSTMLTGILEHNVYHSAQIVVLRKQIEGLQDG